MSGLPDTDSYCLIQTALAITLPGAVANNSHQQEPKRALLQIYISTISSLSLAYSCLKYPRLTSANERHPQKVWSAAGSCDVIFWVISATSCSCYTQCLGCEWVIILGFPPLIYPSSNLDGFCAFVMVDAVVTGEVSCYNCIVQLRSLPQFVELIFFTFDTISF